MKFSRSVVLVVVSLFWFTVRSWAEESDVELPADGWWIRYHSTIKQEDTNGPVEYSAKSTFSLVGTEVVEQEKCRWLEIESVDTYGEKQHVVLRKHLIPEKDLRNAESLTQNIKRGCQTHNDGNENAVRSAKDSDDGHGSDGLV